jgi:hypothetical protein
LGGSNGRHTMDKARFMLPETANRRKEGQDSRYPVGRVINL